MSKLSKEQEALLANVDAIITMIERNKLSLDMFDNIDISLSPMKLLLNLLKRFGVGYDEIVKWLSDYIVYATPVIELAIKGILLSNLKSNIDCNLDPRIPQYLREDIGGCTTTPLFGSINDNVGEIRGVEIDLSTIDYYGQLNVSPMSDDGRYRYFGINNYYTIDSCQTKFKTYDEIVEFCGKSGYDKRNIKKHGDVDSMYELVRANDMNAFLWFVIHKAKFLGAEELNSQKCILEEIREEDNNGVVSLGQPFIQKDGSNQYSVMGLCIKYKYLQTNNSNDSDKVKEPSTPNSGKEISGEDIAKDINSVYSNKTNGEYVIVPTTNVWNGCNWYVDRSRYFDFYNKKERDYNKEFALFRLSMKSVDGRNTNKMIMTIKPAPNVITPKIDVEAKIETVEKKKTLKLNIDGDVPWKFQRILFNSYGKQDFNGKYSVVVGDEKSGKTKTDYRIYDVLNPTKKNGVNGEFSGVELHVNKKTREYCLVSNNNQNIRTVLYECYPGFTIYEFNYDYIMGIKLFDPSVITSQLINGLTNIRLGVKTTKKTTDYKMRVSELVKKMMEEQNYASSDCFYTFSNAEYDAMQEKSELMRHNLYPFQNDRYKATDVSDNNELNNILNEIDSNASLEENVDIINRAFNQASSIVSKEALPEDKYAVEFDFITKAIELVTSIFVESLLSPKLLMVFYVNQKIMGDGDKKSWNIEYLIDAFLNVIMSLISELIEIILFKLLEYAKEKLKYLFEETAKLLLLEQVEFYYRLLSQMIKASSLFRLPNNPNLASTLDNVDYADIDPNDNPLPKDC